MLYPPPHPPHTYSLTHTHTGIHKLIHCTNENEYPIAILGDFLMVDSKEESNKRAGPGARDIIKIAPIVVRLSRKASICKGDR